MQNYYGEASRESSDLNTDACSTAEASSPALERALANVHDEVLARYYGCGLIAPIGSHSEPVHSRSWRDLCHKSAFRRNYGCD